MPVSNSEDMYFNADTELKFPCRLYQCRDDDSVATVAQREGVDESEMLRINREWLFKDEGEGKKSKGLGLTDLLTAGKSWLLIPDHKSAMSCTVASYVGWEPVPVESVELAKQPKFATWRQHWRECTGQDGMVSPTGWWREVWKVTDDQSGKELTVCSDQDMIESIGGTKNPDRCEHIGKRLLLSFPVDGNSARTVETEGTVVAFFPQEEWYMVLDTDKDRTDLEEYQVHDAIKRLQNRQQQQPATQSATPPRPKVAFVELFSGNETIAQVI